MWTVPNLLTIVRICSFPVLIWLGWMLATFLAAFAVLALANAHTQVATATLSIRVLAVCYPVLGGWLFIHLVRRIMGSARDAAG